jgi:hypothetical protein
MNDKKNAISLITDLLSLAESSDERYKLEQFSKQKAERTVGESFWVFHLKILKDIIEKLEIQ